MKPASCKAKGRKLQQYVRDRLYTWFGDHLQPGDIESRSMGASGTDLLLSPAAKRLFPWSVEIKCQEKLNIWDAMDQATANANGLPPLLVFKRNGSPAYACVVFNDFLVLHDGGERGRC